MQISNLAKTSVEEMVIKAAQDHNVDLDIRNEPFTLKTYATFLYEFVTQEVNDTATLICCEDKYIWNFLNRQKYFSHVLFYKGLIAPVEHKWSKDVISNIFAQKSNYCDKCKMVVAFTPCFCGDLFCSDCYHTALETNKLFYTCELCYKRYQATYKTI